MAKVLISSGYGAGWSTWAVCMDDQLLAECPIVIKAYEEHQDEWPKDWAPSIGGKSPCLPLWGHEMLQELEAWLQAHGVDEMPYLGGLGDISVREVPDGTAYRINEHDGSERLEIIGDIDFFVAGKNFQDK